MPRRAPTALLKDRAEEAERRVLELQGNDYMLWRRMLTYVEINHSPA